MIIYPNTETELYWKDYKALPLLRGLSVAELAELVDNLEKAQENAFLSGNDMLSLAIDMDIRKAELYLKMYTRKQEKAKAK